MQTSVHFDQTLTQSFLAENTAFFDSIQDVFVDLALTDGAPLRWWHIENPGGGSRSGVKWFTMGESGRSYAAGIADPVVDVCGMRVMDGLFVAAFD